MTKDNSLKLINILRSFLQLFYIVLFWMFFFFIQKILFISYNFVLFSNIPWVESTPLFFHGLRLDLATACYLSIISYFIILLQLLIKHPIIKQIATYVSFFVLLIVLLLCLGNTLLYKEWQSLLNKRALSFLLYPKEIIASLKFSYLLLSLLLISAMHYFFFQIWQKYLIQQDQTQKTTLLSKLVFIFISPILLGIAARGGFQLIPINESSAYFSTSTAVNHAAVNPIWYLGNNIWSQVENDTKYQYMQQKIAEQLVTKLFKTGTDSIPQIINTQQPNIIFLILESHTADVMASLGGEKGVCPTLDSLASEGLLFTQIYGSGMRTDQGLVSILSGFPAQPDQSIIKYTSKVSKLPSLYKDLSAKGYHSSFYYGGEIEFANIGAYLRQAGIEKISDIEDYSTEQLNSKWGAHDEFVLSKQLSDLSHEQQPFFSVVLTLTNHEPFEVPNHPKFEAKDEANRFRNTAAYTDKCLKNYFQNAAKQKWYNNTLFVLVADHGHRLPQNNDMNLAKAKHIPLLFFGNALKSNYVGYRCTKIGNQNDLAATLLCQLNLTSDRYVWSKNLLNSGTNDFAYYSNETVLGWISKSDSIAYSYVEKKNIANNRFSKINELNAKAYLQQVYAAFNSF